MIIYGASGHGKVIEDIVEAMGGTVSCFIDDNKNLLQVHGIPVLHGYKKTSEPLIIAIGNNATRKRVSLNLDADFGKAIHPSAIISPRALIGVGTVVMPGAIVNTDAIIGRHCIINTGVSIDHECKLDDFVHISPHSTLCGNVYVGEGSWIGAGSTIIQGIKIGKWVVVGAGSVVTEDIPDYSLVIGNRQYVLKANYYQHK